MFQAVLVLAVPLAHDLCMRSISRLPCFSRCLRALQTVLTNFVFPWISTNSPPSLAGAEGGHERCEAGSVVRPGTDSIYSQDQRRSPAQKPEAFRRIPTSGERATKERHTIRYVHSEEPPLQSPVGLRIDLINTAVRRFLLVRCDECKYAAELDASFPSLGDTESLSW